MRQQNSPHGAYFVRRFDAFARVRRSGSPAFFRLFDFFAMTTEGTGNRRKGNASILDIKSDLYDKAFQQWNMTPVASERSYAQAGCSYRMDNEEGSGEYWVYSRDNFFAISAFRIEFKSQGIMRFRHTEHLSVSYYDKAGLIAKARTATPRPGTVSTYIAS